MFSMPLPEVGSFVIFDGESYIYMYLLELTRWEDDLNDLFCPQQCRACFETGKQLFSTLLFSQISRIAALSAQVFLLPGP